jgi:hypothetical protein
MEPSAVNLERAIAEKRARLAGPAGYKGLIANYKVFFFALFASLGGLLYVSGQ